MVMLLLVTYGGGGAGYAMTVVVELRRFWCGGGVGGIGEGCGSIGSGGAMVVAMQ